MIKNTDRYKVWIIDLDFILSIIGCNLPLFYGDDYCDDENNNAECQFDNGDCCGSNVNIIFCTECQCLSDEGSIGGNGTTTPSLTTNSGWCAIPNDVGNGYCADENNNTGCNFDNGDFCASNVNTDYCSLCLCLE